MKTVYYSLLASGSTIGILSLGLLGTASPLRAETSDLSPKAAVSQNIQLSAAEMPKETPKQPENGSSTVVPASPALQQKFNPGTPPPPSSEPSGDFKMSPTPILPASPAIPSPTAPTPTAIPISKPSTVAPTPAPEALYTPANPLLFPTKDSEVKTGAICNLDAQKVQTMKALIESQIRQNSKMSEQRESDALIFQDLKAVNKGVQPCALSPAKFRSIRSMISQQADQAVRATDLQTKVREANTRLSQASDAFMRRNIENEIKDLNNEIKELNSEGIDLNQELDLVIKSFPLTLSQTLELAERNNRDLEVSRLQVEQQRFAVREAQANLFPTLDLQSSFTRSLSSNGTLSIQSAQAEAIARAGGDVQQARQQDAFTGGSLFRRSLAEESTTWDTSLQLNYDLYTSGANAARRRIAEGRLRSAELAMERVREQLRLDATGDYYDLQEADEQVRINQKAVENSLQSLKDTQLQERVGLGTRFDVLRSQVQLANNRQQRANARSAQTIRRRQIAQRLSLPEYVAVIADDTVEKQGQWTLPLEATIVKAYKQRVELEEQLVQRDISDATRKQALSALGPRIQLRASYDLLKVFEQPISGLTSGYSLSAVAQWRLFDGGAARAQAEQQVVDGKIAETRFTQSRNAVRFQVEQAYATMLSNDKNIETTSTALNQASEALRLAKLRFQAGVGTQTDVINAETDLTRAEGNRITAILGYNRAIAQLRRSVSNVASE